MKIIFLMGGSSAKNSERYPIYLTEINGTLILEEQIRRIGGVEADFIFCVKAEDDEKYNVGFIIQNILPSAVLIKIQNDTCGAVCTALLAAQYIDTEEEVIILAIDDFIDESAQTLLGYFREKECELGLVVFKSVHPRYSFVLLNESGKVIESSTKRPISNIALSSFYYFRRGKDFVEGAKNIIRKDVRINGSFYMSQVINELILEEKQIELFSIPNEKYHPFKNEIQLAQYISLKGGK